MTYRGQTIPLAHYYWSYDGFKNDPHNIPPAEIPRIQRLMRGAPVARHYAMSQDLVMTLNDIVFPGYGVAIGGMQIIGGPRVEVWQIEMPPGEISRAFVFRENEHGVDLLDDFIVTETTGTIEKIVLQRDGTLTYFDVANRPLARHRVSLPVESTTK